MYWAGHWKPCKKIPQNTNLSISAFHWPALAPQPHLSLQHRSLSLSHTLAELQQCNSKSAANGKGLLWSLHKHPTRGTCTGKKSFNKAVLAGGWTKDNIKWFKMHHPQRHCWLLPSLPVRSTGNLQKDPCKSTHAISSLPEYIGGPSWKVVQKIIFSVSDAKFICVNIVAVG